MLPYYTFHRLNIAKISLDPNEMPSCSAYQHCGNIEKNIKKSYRNRIELENNRKLRQFDNKQHRNRRQKPDSGLRVISFESKLFARIFLWSQPVG